LHCKIFKRGIFSRKTFNFIKKNEANTFLGCSNSPNKKEHPMAAVHGEATPLMTENYVPFRRLIVKYHLFPISLSVVALGMGSGATVALGTGDDFVRVVLMVIGIFSGIAALFYVGTWHLETTRGNLVHPENKPLINLVKLLTATTAFVGMALSVSSFFLKHVK
jgi:hypothetical protein